MQPLTPSVTDTYSRIVYSNFTAWANPGVNANKHLCYIVMSCSATSVASSTNTKIPVYLSLGYFHVCTYIYMVTNFKCDIDTYPHRCFIYASRFIMRY